MHAARSHNTNGTRMECARNEFVHVIQAQVHLPSRYGHRSLLHSLTWLSTAVNLTKILYPIKRWFISFKRRVLLVIEQCFIRYLVIGPDVDHGSDQVPSLSVAPGLIIQLMEVLQCH